MIGVVTSCSLSGWEEYGQNFMKGWMQYWPAQLPLYLISEDELPVAHIPLQRSLSAVEFLEKNDNPRARGKVRVSGDEGWKPKKIAAGYNFRYDAFRFAKKVYAIELAAGIQRGGKLFWLDMDVTTFAPVNDEFLDALLPDNVALSCLQRGTYHSECGFVGYNLDHPQCSDFIREFAALYSSGEVFELQEWHDSWVFDWLRKDLKVDTFAIPNRSRSHPFVNSVLGTVMDHLKGERKTKGTNPMELVINRDIPYWRDK